MYHEQLQNRGGRRRLLVRGIIRRVNRPRREMPRGGKQTFMRVFFLFVLLTISITTALLAWHIHPRYAAPMLLAYELIILAFILVRPKNVGGSGVYRGSINSIDRQN